MYLIRLWQIRKVGINSKMSSVIKLWLMRTIQTFPKSSSLMLNKQRVILLIHPNTKRLIPPKISRKICKKVSQNRALSPSMTVLLSSSTLLSSRFNEINWKKSKTRKKSKSGQNASSEKRNSKSSKLTMTEIVCIGRLRFKFMVMCAIII